MAMTENALWPVRGIHFGIELFAFVSKNPKIGPKMAQIVDHAVLLFNFTGHNKATLGYHYGQKSVGARSNMYRAGVDCPVVPTSP